MKSRSAKPPTTSVTGDNRCFPYIFLHWRLDRQSVSFLSPLFFPLFPFSFPFLSKTPPSIRACHAASKTILATISWRVDFFFHARRVRCTPHMSGCKAVKSAFSLFVFSLDPSQLFCLVVYELQFKSEHTKRVGVV